MVLTMEALRAVERHGAVRRQEQYAGFKALPAGSGGPSHGGMTVDEARRIVWRYAGCMSPLKRDDQERADQTAYRAAVKRAHPDRPTGSRVAWDELEQAQRVLDEAGAA